MEKRIPPSSELFHNAFRVVKTEKGLVPRRFTDSRIAIFDRSELYSVRARSSAGVAIRFRLAAPLAGIGYALERVHRGIPRADLFVDGAYAKTFVLGPQDRDAEGSLEILAPSADGAEIELVLPYQATFTLTGITLPEGGSVEPVPERRGLFLFFGDSITQGQLAAHPSSAYGYRLSRLFGRSCRNFAVGGHVFDPDSIDPEIASLAPERVFVAYGTNDWSSGMDRGLFRENCSAYLRGLRSAFPTPPITVILPLFRTDEDVPKNEATLDCFRRIIAEEAARVPGAAVVPGKRLLPPDEDFLEDGLHPNDEGVRLLTLNLAEIVSAGLLRP